MITDATMIAMSLWGKIGLGCGLFIGGLAVLWIVSVRLDRPRIRRLRETHIQTHPNLSDEDFIRQIQVLGERADVALGVRKGVATAMGVPAVTLYPSDHLEYIVQFGFDNMSLLEINLSIAKTLNIRMYMSFWEPLYSTKREFCELSVGELARFVAEHWESLSNSQAVKAKSADR